MIYLWILCGVPCIVMIVSAAWRMWRGPLDAWDKIILTLAVALAVLECVDTILRHLGDTM